MSLMRLLTAGKILVGSQNPASRYRMHKRRMLPKFEAKENPFMAKEAEVQLPSVRVMSKPEPVQVPTAPKEIISASIVETAGTETETIQRAPKSKIFKPQDWMQKLKDLVFHPRLLVSEKPAVPRSNRPAIQGELSLDNVRVVRNDLSDTDFDVVPVKAPEPPEREMTMPAPDLEPEYAGRGGRSGVSFRFFGAEET